MQQGKAFLHLPYNVLRPWACGVRAVPFCRSCILCALLLYTTSNGCMRSLVRCRSVNLESGSAKRAELFLKG